MRAEIARRICGGGRGGEILGGNLPVCSRIHESFISQNIDASATLTLRNEVLRHEQTEYYVAPLKQHTQNSSVCNYKI